MIQVKEKAYDHLEDSYYKAFWQKENQHPFLR